jgi:hypothetical protein
MNDLEEIVMFDVKTFGTLSTTGKYEKKVSISYDTLEYDSEADVKVLVQIEPPLYFRLIHGVPDIVKEVSDNAENFDLILTWNKDLLHLPNAQKFVFGCCWIDWDNYNPEKKNQVSFITSNKSWAPGHQIRLSIWDGLEDAEDLNGFEILKHKSPPRVESKNFLFENAKYSITTENEKLENWITEKVIDCFATKTIPIYWGCPNIGEYFNTDGILAFDTLEELKDILDNLDESFYDKNLDSIEENFEKSKQYWNFHERVEKIIKNFIANEPGN